ncbi:MAG: ABC transporter permease, partial [Verrucomicrobia bacterium]|nr:ABC transporter permease [Verrucomicrobiota bacterium]
MPKLNKQHLTHLLTEYGMILVLILLGLFFSAVTLTEQRPSGETAGLQVAENLKNQLNKDANVLIASRDLPLDKEFATSLTNALTDSGFHNIFSVTGDPRAARAKLDELHDQKIQLQAIAGNQTTADWLVFADIPSDFHDLGSPTIYGPNVYKWPNFLKQENLLNITNQIAVIAIIAIGMTVVIISGGIDLSVGSLIAFSAVLSCLFIRNVAGGLEATAIGMVLTCFAAIFITGMIGSFTGSMITAFSIPPFIVTLGMMMMASGTAYLLSGGESVYQVPDSFVWLGREASLFGIPNAVFLMALLYVLAHVMMSRTKLGRYIYAVGGNPEAARLSGVPVKRVQLFAYTLSGLLAGL